MKNWGNNNIDTTQYSQINKIIVKQSIKFYCKAWQHRNESYFNESKYKEYMIEWNSNLINEINNSNKTDMPKMIQNDVK